MRDDFLRQKHTKEERAEFFKDNETRRQEYFSNEREKRNDFESDMRDKRKNFEDYVREKNNEFNQEHRSYTKRYDEMKKQEREEKALKEKQGYKASGGPGVPSAGVQPFMSSESPEAADLEREIEEIKKRMGSPLGTGE